MGIVYSELCSNKGILRPERDGIPCELTERGGWACWRAVEENGQVRKVPIDPTSGRYASVKDPGTWARYQDAVAAYEGGGLDGIGILLGYEWQGPNFQMGKSLSGFDFDNCVHPETGEIDPKVLELLKALNSYAEISPSGRGVKGFVFGPLMPGRCRQPGVEIYGPGRYFTVTGRHVEGLPRRVEERGSVVMLLQAHLLAGSRS